MAEEEDSWIYASGLDGAEQITLTLSGETEQENATLSGEAEQEKTTPPRETEQENTRYYTVRLFFSEPDGAGPGERLFDVFIQDQKLLNGFDVAGEDGGRRRGLVREFRDIPVTDDLVITMTKAEESLYPPVISGVEIILH